MKLFLKKGHFFKAVSYSGINLKLIKFELGLGAIVAQTKRLPWVV